MSIETVQIRQKGVLTIPASLRRKYSLGEGDVYTLVDLGDGSFLLTPQVSQVNQYGDQIARLAQQEDVDVDELLTALAEERERYYSEQYVGDDN
jgi:bifunctional DNA-binding transcriptional regulator/antitoxin component of YhaV-PrlF toxin-antitoxin module